MGTGLSVSARGCQWSLTIQMPDGGQYPPFQDYHQQEMAAADLKRFIWGRDLTWERQVGEYGREELITRDNGFRLRLTTGLDQPLDAENMVAELEERLSQAD